VENLFQCDAAQKYKCFCEHVENKINWKPECCLSDRLHIINRNQNTNKYVDATFRILKYIALNSFNSVTLLDFINNVLYKSHSKRLLDMAFGRMKKHL
jgi:hypothetical protein